MASSGSGNVDFDRSKAELPEIAKKAVFGSFDKVRGCIGK